MPSGYVSLRHWVIESSDPTVVELVELLEVLVAVC